MRGAPDFEAKPVMRTVSPLRMNFRSLPSGILHRLSTAPADFQHGAEGTFLGAADCARSHHVAGMDVAAVDRVVRKLLAHVPVHVLEIGTAHREAFAIFGNDFHFEGHVVMALSLVSEVRQNRRVLVRSRNAIRRQSVQRDDPRAHAGTKTLAQERAERHVFPFLDVARGPIVEQRQAEDEVIRLGRADRFAQRLSTVGHERHFQFEVQQPRWAEYRRCIVVGTRLARRTSDRRSAHHDA